MELKIISPSADGFIKAIEFNNDELKKELSLRLEKYKGIAYNEEEIKLAKSDRATLNKLKDAIENRRKEIKAQCLRPYEEFEIKIKEILALIDEPVKEIDKQVKAFENSQKEEKKEIITGVYDETIGDLKDILPLEKIWSSKWLNKTYRLPVITEEIIKTVERVRTDLKNIEDLKSEFEIQIKDRYLETLLISEALALKTRLEEQKKKLEELKRQKEARLKQQDVATQIQTEIMKQEPQESELELLEFRLWVTQEQKLFLRNYILTNKIKAGKVR